MTKPTEIVTTVEAINLQYLSMYIEAMLALSRNIPDAILGKFAKRVSRLQSALESLDEDIAIALQELDRGV